jgi:ABC-2 type transport system ATP-binding protein
VDHIGLEIPKGTIFGFLGPNGAGKTTTIRLLLGLLEPTEGHAEVLGFESRTEADNIRTHCGALLEHPGIYERLSAEENLEFYGRIWQLPSADRQNRIRELLTHLDLWDRRKETAGTWSRGMKQKLAVARALLHRPSLIFLDEPTAGLDPVAAAALREDLATLVASEGLTVFLTTHNLAEAERLCDAVAVIRRGRILAVGPPGELGTKNAAPRVEVFGRGFSGEMIALLRSREEVASAELYNHRVIIQLNRTVNVAPLVTLMVGAGAEIEEVRKGNPSLEEVFLTLMEEER